MGLDSVEIIVGLENAFNIRIPDAVNAKILTPRDLVVYISSVIEIKPSKHCETQRIFYALRRKFPNARAWFKPETKLTDLLVARDWQKLWTDLRLELSSNAPARLPGFIFNLELQTVRELVFWVAQENLSLPQSFTRETVVLTVRKVICKVLGIHGFSLDAQLVRDLGVN